MAKQFTVVEQWDTVNSEDPARAMSWALLRRNFKIRQKLMQFWKVARISKVKFALTPLRWARRYSIW